MTARPCPRLSAAATSPASTAQAVGRGFALFIEPLAQAAAQTDERVARADAPSRWSSTSSSGWRRLGSVARLAV